MNRLHPWRRGIRAAGRTPTLNRVAVRVIPSDRPTRRRLGILLSAGVVGAGVSAVGVPASTGATTTTVPSTSTTFTVAEPDSTDTTVPDTTVPDTTVPDATVPDVTVPESSAPSAPDDSTNVVLEGGESAVVVDVAGAADTILPSLVAISGDVIAAGEPYRVAGTGVAVSADGAIVTNAHVVQDVVNLRVRFAGETEPIPAVVLSADIGNDLALLRVDRHDLVPARFATDVRIGQPVIAVGFPLALDGDASVTLGIVSALNRTLIDEASGGALDSLIQTDAPLSSGNSGGPLVNSAGEVVGITTAVAPGALGASVNDIGFAISSREVLKVLGELWEHRAGSVRQEGFLGITVAERMDGGQGAVVSSVQPGTPAASAGLLADDIVVAVGGEPIAGAGGLVAAIRDRQPGDVVTLTIRRDGGTTSLTATLTTRP